MGKTLHKAAMMKEFIKSGKGDFTNWQELEQQMKDYVRDNGIHIPSGRNGNYVTNDIYGGMKRTQEILDGDPALRKLFDQAAKKNQKDQGMDPTGLGDKKGGKGGKGGQKGGRTGGRTDRGTGWGDTRPAFDWDFGDDDDDGGRGRGRSKRMGGYRDRKSLKEILFSPLGVVLAVIALCIFLYEVVGPAAYEFIMNGPFFKILLIILAGAAVVAILKSARGWPSGVKFTVILVIGLVLLYSVVGPAIYAFLMSGILFKLICLVIAAAAVIGILKADLGWPIGVKIVVIIVILAVLKSEVL